MRETLFSKLSDDVVLNILDKLEEDPRHWARLSCVSTKFSSLIRNICWKNKCQTTIPSVVADLVLSTSSASPPGGWASLNKLAVCCPGLLHAGVLLENSDFGLERDLGPDENYHKIGSFRSTQIEKLATSLSIDENYQKIGSVRATQIKKLATELGPGENHQKIGSVRAGQIKKLDTEPSSSSSNCCSNGQADAVAFGSDNNCAWSLFDDLYFDTVYNVSENHDEENPVGDEVVVERGRDSSVSCKKRKVCRSLKPHMASVGWNLSREQGNKLLASRFRGDCLYICDWPGCVHIEEKRNYMLFRGVFKKFKLSRVWRTINDGNRSKIDLNCAFCSCKETWDLHSAFCLRRVFGFHDDGEPVVRAYVCENGHVSGAWTDWPLYT